MVKWQVFLNGHWWTPLLLLCPRKLAPPVLPHGPPSPLTGIPTQIRTSHAARQSPELGMQFNPGESCLPQDCIGSPGSQFEAVSSYPYVDEARPGTKQKIFVFLCWMTAHLIPSVSHRDRSWGHTWRGWWSCWRWSWWRHGRVGSVRLFLSRRLGPSVSLRCGLQIVGVVWWSCLLLVCCVAFSWLFLGINKSEFFLSDSELCLPYKLLRCRTFLLSF